MWVGWAATLDSERGPEALGRVHYTRDIVFVHCWMDRVGWKELSDSHQG